MTDSTQNWRNLKGAGQLEIVSNEEPRLDEGESVSALSIYLERAGYARLDNEYLLAKIIELAGDVTASDNNDVALEAAFRLGRVVEQYNNFQKADSVTEKPRDRKSLRPHIRKALIELGPGVSNKGILAWFRVKGIATEFAGIVTQQDGKKIKLDSFRKMASEERNSAMGPRSRNKKVRVND